MINMIRIAIQIPSKFVSQNAMNYESVLIPIMTCYSQVKSEELGGLVAYAVGVA